MHSLKWFGSFGLAMMFVAGGTAVAEKPSTGAVTLSSIDLSKPFATRSAWQFTASQGPAIEDPTGGAGGDTAPGKILLCLSKDRGRSCDLDLQKALHPAVGDDLFSEPHFLNNVEVVHPRGQSDRALLLLQFASLHSGNGDQRIATLVLAYDQASDRFVKVYQRNTGRNNNQEVRYIADGPLKGDIVAAEPTADAPFGFWITVDRLDKAYAYQPAVRFRSATRYGDGNPLAVIDSEMPNIQKRLGIWRSGMPLPVPAGQCPKPHLVATVLWCK